MNYCFLPWRCFYISYFHCSQNLHDSRLFFKKKLKGAYRSEPVKSRVPIWVLIDHSLVINCPTNKLYSCIGLLISNNNNASDVLQAGPIRLFVPYKCRKWESSQSRSPVRKKRLSLSSENSRREGKDSRLKMGTLNK